MATTEVGTAQVAFEVHGHGDGDGGDVLLVHGTGGAAFQWAPVVPALTGRWRVVVPDLSGSGGTSDDGGPLTVDALAAQVLGVADAAGAGQFHLAGYSLGAAVAVAVAAAAPGRVRSLAAVCGWARSSPELALRFRMWEDLVARDRDLFGRYLVVTAATESWLAEHGGGLEQYAALIGAALAPGTGRQAALDAALDVEDRLAQVVAPTLVVGATEDRILPFEHSRHLAGAIAGAELAAVDANHLYPLEQPDHLAGLLSSFFSRHDGRR